MMQRAVAGRRPIFLIRVRAEPDTDVIRALRSWLKVGLRAFGLRCVSIEETKHQENTMDMRKYSTDFIKPDHVRDHPLQAVIINVFISEKTNRPVLDLESGEQFTVNATNSRALCKAFGNDSDGWINQTIELSLGTYRDWSSASHQEKETVVVKAISSREGTNGGQRTDPALPAPPADGDEIPF
jgi:hypothetical protein